MSLAACIIRLSGHDFMDFRNNSGVITGGADGCVNFNDPDNAGLAQCLASSNILPVYQTYCQNMSVADFIVLAAEAFIIRTATNYNPYKLFAQGNYE